MRNSLSSVKTKSRAVFSQVRLESVVGLTTAWVDKDLGDRCGKKHSALSPPFTQQNQPPVLWDRAGGPGWWQGRGRRVPACPHPSPGEVLGPSPAGRVVL